ncbi:MAG: hypothetical protein LH614_00110 [Pyrinomonadaceae bacterium]|nr:hypothetical protein [Pyrinomonadaceae bacterium]
MSKNIVVSIVFFLGGAISFAIALYVLQSYWEFLDLFAFYSIPEKIYAARPETANTIFNFKIGIAKYTLLGTVDWIASIYFLVKRFKKHE